ncbi:MAG: inositol monophosphatase [Candidatus Cloacimonetes bacterium]|nr:inositol monophosphatase [Candidatus Cloacimonadota bacterium]MBS3766573.1 inositol monophosphatase [Candidatus Cloacimonadota bacterium]
MQKYFDIAQKAAKAAGKIIKNNFHKKKNVSYKGRIDLVTDIDKRAEDAIIQILKNNFPDHNILTEESDFARDDRSEYCWVIDPLDGTTNYVHEFPFVNVSVALQKSKESIVGVVFNPILDEFFYAIKGRGSYKNEQRLVVSQSTELKKSVLATGFPYEMKGERNNLDNFNKIIKECRGVRRPGAAALDLCYVAAGIFDGFWEMELHPWDTAAGILIVEEAGGKIAKFDGAEFSIFDKEIVATNGKIHEKLINILGGIIKSG